MLKVIVSSFINMSDCKTRTWQKRISIFVESGFKDKILCWGAPEQVKLIVLQGELAWARQEFFSPASTKKVEKKLANAT